MDQIYQLIARLNLKQRITIVIAAVLVVAGLVYLSRWNKERNFRPLFTNLAAEDAGQVVAKIRESGSEFRLAADGTTVLVPAEKVAEMRLQLATAGLPKSGRLGFEIFDKTNFGATDFTEQVNFHRALEGELERSVTSIADVEQARVHITFPKDSIYTESKQPAKASVTVKLRPGRKLSPQSVLAICHLAASAVEGLQPESVSVLDTQGNLLNRPRRASTDGLEASEASIEFRQRLERDLMAKVNATLEPLLGADKYRAAVSLECDDSSGEQSEEVFDPAKSVMVTSQRTEDSPAGVIASGVPGTASNLPRPLSRPGSGVAGASRRTENIAYQSSRFVKHTRIPQGAIRRMSVSVLLDHSVRFEKDKRILEPPGPEKLKVVKDLIAGVTGAVTDRGDQIIVESFPFEATLHTEAAPAPAPPPAAGAEWAPKWLQDLLKQKNFAVIAGSGAGVALALLLAMIALVLRSVRRKKRISAEMAQKAVEGGEEKKAIDQPPDVEKQIQDKLAEQAMIKEQQTREVLASLKLPAVTTKKTEVLVKHIAAEAKKDPESMAQVIRSLLNAENS